MTREGAFLADIAEHPDDDAPRLIYADWLEEHGNHARAEFIRTQVALARLTSDSPRRRQLAARARELLGKHGKKWAGAVRPILEEWHFHRGFLDRVTISAANLIKDAEKVFRLWPIRRLRLTGAGGRQAFLAALPSHASITSLDLIANDLTDVVPALATCPALRHLSRLVLSFNPLTDQALATLAEHHFFDSLRELQLVSRISRSRSKQLSRRFGNRLTFTYVREDDHLYCFGTEGRSYWMGGLGHDFTQVLIVLVVRGLQSLFFDLEGNLVATETTPCQGSTPQQGYDSRAAELGLKQAAIHVKRFRTEDGEMLLDSLGSAKDYMEQGPAEDREGILRSLRELWLPQGQFEFTAGNNPWIDRKGEIVAT